jgi:hypothetical protein
MMPLPAEDGRRRRPPAGPALRRVEEVVTSRNHQRIDRPLLPERPLQRPLAGRLVSRTPGQGGVDGHAGVHGALTPRTVSGRLPHAGHRCGHGAGPRQPPRHGNLCGAAESGSGTSASAGPRPPQVSMVGVRPPWPPQPSVPDRSGPAAGAAGHFRCGRPHAVQVPDTRGRSAASGVAGGCGGYGNWSPG